MTVTDFQLVSEELVVVAEKPHDLFDGALADLYHGGQLLAVLVVHGVLVVDFDQLAFLVDHEHRFGEQCSTALGCGALRARALDLFVYPFRGVDAGDVQFRDAFEIGTLFGGVGLVRVTLRRTLVPGAALTIRLWGLSLRGRHGLSLVRVLSLGLGWNLCLALGWLRSRLGLRSLAVGLTSGLRLLGRTGVHMLRPLGAVEVPLLRRVGGVRVPACRGLGHSATIPEGNQPNARRPPGGPVNTIRSGTHRSTCG